MMNNLRIGFEAEFVSVQGDYVDINPLAETMIGTNFDILTMFDLPDWDADYWYLCEDSSINEDDGNGVELISPPMGIDMFGEQIERVMDFISDIGYTNDSCALHLNISGPSIPELDKILSHFHYMHWLEIFDRLENEYARVPEPEMNPVEKSYVVNLHKSTHVEFKHIGGRNYHKRITDIREAVNASIESYNRAMG